MNRAFPKIRGTAGRLLVAVAASALSAPHPAGAGQPQMSPEAEYQSWARVLQRHVDAQGRVDFAGLSADSIELKRFVEWIGAVAPGNRPDLFPTRAHVLAYHLNAYNALAMAEVIDEGIPRTLRFLERVRFFYLRKFPIGGKRISLYDYENEVIRPLGEERVHFALNCMSVGCPRLPRSPFLPETLERDLDREARRFLGESRNLRADTAARTVHLSEIFKFYEEDFPKKAPSLVAYVNRYRAPALPDDFRVELIPYDWTVNRQAPD
jgi:uncharacterized protein DUF547